jgi:hypothetical protein
MPELIVGMAWYRPEDYPRVLQIMIDAHRLPRTYNQWRQKAEAGERSQKAAGRRVVRVILDPETFPAWCAARGLNVDAKGRTAFAAERAIAQAKH